MTATLRIGILNDMADGPPAPDDTERWLRLCCDELIQAGHMPGDVAFVRAWGLGLPAGTAAAVERAYDELAAQDVALIVGPAIGDNALVATPLAERHGIPTLNWAGTERARSPYMFHIQVGSHEDESILLAHYLGCAGAARIGVIYDQSPIGLRHLDFLEAEADRLGLLLVATQPVSPLAETAAGETAAVLGARIDAFVYLGLGLSTPAVARAARAQGWSGPCLMNTAGLRGYVADYAREIDGWVYVDMHSDDNRTLAALCERMDVPPRRRFAAAKGYDMGRLVAEAVARAPAPTRDGLKDGLERVKWLPAAQGHEGTLLGFGNYDRGALHGRYLVLRQWRGGTSVEVKI